MAMGATMSVLGLYTFDDTLFSGLSVPEDFDASTKQILIDNLVMECAELEVLYPNWDFMQMAITQWSAKELPTWQRIYNAMIAEYDPIENYNRIEDMSDTHSGSIKHTGTDTASHSGYDSDVGSGSDTDTHSKTSFDNNTYANVEKIEMGRGATDTHNYNSSIGTTYGHTITDTTKVTRAGTIHGNIGVTTSQQMLEQEMLIVPKLNVMNYIIEAFKNRFCILVY